MRRMILLAVAAAAFSGCSDSGVVEPRMDAMRGASFTIPTPNHKGLTVMTRNVDEGANLDPILLATDPSVVPIAVGQIWGEVVSNNFPERAGQLAREIASASPQLVGLQEVALWRLQTGPNPFVPATTVAYDYLHILLDSLHALGANYDSVFAQAGGDVQLPGVVSVSPLTIVGVRLTEREAIIARHDVHVWDARGGNYQAAVHIALGGTTISETRNWVSARTRAGGHEIRFVTTHLTQQRNQSVQVAQASELIDLLRHEHDPVILTGDFNSAADGSQTPTYGMLVSSGYDDVWADRYPHAAGFTCCASDDLHDAALHLASDSISFSCGIRSSRMATGSSDACARKSLVSRRRTAPRRASGRPTMPAWWRTCYSRPSLTREPAEERSQRGSRASLLPTGQP